MRRQSRTILLFLTSVFFVYFVSRGDLASHSPSVSVRDYTLIEEPEDYFLRLAEDFDRKRKERTKRSDGLDNVSPLGSNLDPRYIYNRDNAYHANEGARHIQQQYSRDQYLANGPENDETKLELDIKSPNRPIDVQLYLPSIIQPPSHSSVSANPFQPTHNLIVSISTSPSSLISVEHISAISPTPSIKDIAPASHTFTTSHYSSLNAPSFSIPQPYNIEHSNYSKLPSIPSSESYPSSSLSRNSPIPSPSDSASPSSPSTTSSSSSSSPPPSSSLSSPSSRHMTFIPPIPTYYQEFGSHPLPPQVWYMRDADKGRWVAYFHDQSVATLHYTPDGLVDNCTILEVIETWEQRKALRYLGAVMPLRPVSLPDMVHIMALCGELTTPSTPPPPSSPASRSKSDWWLGSSLLVGILPGTMWCGRRDQAGSYHHLGLRTRLDSCCRTHDHCPVKLRPFVYRYTISNIALSTKLHCLCEVEFYRCLKNIQDPLADSVGELYFNILGNDCIDASPPRQRRPPKSSNQSPTSPSSQSSNLSPSGSSSRQSPSSKDASLSPPLPNQSYLSESLPTSVPLPGSSSKYAAQPHPSLGNPSISQPSSAYPSPPQSSSNHPSLLQPSSTSPPLLYPPPHTSPSSTNSGGRESKEMGEVRRRMECSSKDAEGECRLWLLNPKATVKYILRPTNLKY